MDLTGILAGPKRDAFIRTLTEKMLTYALGRGLEDYDVLTVDQIVDRIEKNDGRFSALLLGVIESAPFQKRREARNETVAMAVNNNKVSPTSPASPPLP